MSGRSSHARFGAAAVVAVAVAAAVGGVAALVGVGSSADRRSPKEAMVDIGGFKFNRSCSGRGSPTVLLESGNGPTSAGWSRVQAEIAGTTRVCSYDRAGTGRSDESPDARDAEHIAQELHRLLDVAEIDRPLVVVGHSYGGLYVRQYAAMYPADVAGMVLVDSAHPDQWTRHPAAAEQFASMVASMPEPIRVAPPDPPVNPDLPSAAGQRMATDGNTVKHLNPSRGEFLSTAATNDQVRRSSVSLGDRPLLVLSATEHDFPPDLHAQMAGMHLELQRELAGLSSQALHRLAEGADHNGLLTKADTAHTTARSVQDVLHAVRTASRLPAS
jgi:pimeloyl-ACP methyl ester carboxylesterase